MTCNTELEKKAQEIFQQLKQKDFKLTNPERMKIPQQEMPSQDPKVRARNTKEVALGYTETQAIVEANRCLSCPTQPCQQGCPVHLPIRDFIQLIAKKDYASAIAAIKTQSLLPAVCGRVCPQESQCQKYCTVGKIFKNAEKSVAIGRLERFVADWERAQGTAAVPTIKPATGKKVAIIGSGPAGLTAAADIRREGHEVTLFEAFHKFGGVMQYGIPEFRLPKSIVTKEVNALREMGVKMIPNFLIGRTRTLEELFEKDGFDALFIGIGAGLPNFMGIEGENLIGVFSANEYLTRANLMRAYEREKSATPIAISRKVAVLGGGNVAMDSARTALRLGAEEVHLIYRRSENEIPARIEEIHHAKEEGVQFHFLCNAKRILGDDKSRVQSIECLKYELGEPDASGRRSPIVIPNSEYTMAVDTVIVAIGNRSNPLIRQTSPSLAFNKKGNLICDEDCRTSNPRIFAGGDIVLGAATVILAMGQGRKAAKAINELLEKEP